MPTLTLRLLGGLTIELDTQPVDGLKTTKAQALLVYLALTGRAHTRHELAGLLWSEDPEDKAKNSLRVALANLNKALPGYIESDRLIVAFRRDQPHRIDAVDFDAQAQAGADQEQSGTAPPALLDALQAAADYYTGDFLHDFYVGGAPEFEAWQLNAREHYRQVALSLFERLGDAYLAARRYAEAVDAFTRLVSLEPWYEAAHRHLMLAYSRMGNFNRALAQYERCRTVLEAELDVPPMPETDALYDRIRAAREHHAAPLPADPAPFVGRAAELAEIGRLLLQPGCRLVTIVGLGGSGKTRIAVEAARRANAEQAVEFLNGVHFVSLTDVDSVDGFAPALVEALAITGSGRNPLRRQLFDYLQGKEMLLVLDNFEHLLPAVDLLVEILANAPGVKLLVTSREPLQIAQEWRVVLGGMAYPPQPNDDDFTAYDAIQLFVQAARQVQPGFAITADNRADLWRLCRAVDGTPLALTLAAPWLRATGIAAVVQEVEAGIDILATGLRNIPARQRSLRVVCEHSWQRLAPSEQDLLARLAVFRGGCTLEAAQAVAGATLPNMAALVDRAFLRYSHNPIDPPSANHRFPTNRYFLHELIRQFAAEKLADMDAAGVPLMAVHGRYFAAWVQTCYTRYRAGEFPQVMADWSGERDNVRAAWLWLVDCVRDDVVAAEAAGLLETLAQFAHVLAWYSRKAARYAEGLEVLDAARTALDQARKQAQSRAGLAHAIDGAYMRVQVYYASLLYYTGAYVETQQLVEEALPLFQAAGWVAEEAIATDTLSKCTRRRGDYAATKALAARTKALYAAIDDEVGQMQSVVAVAVVAADEGDYALAETLGREAVAFYAQLNDTASLLLTQSNLANTFIRQEKYAAAKPLLEEAYARAGAEGNLFSLVMTATNLASVTEGLGDDERAEHYAREALGQAREIGDRRWTATNLNHLSRIAIRKGAWQVAEENARAALTITRAISSEMDIMSDLSCLAYIWAHRGKPDAALRLLVFVANHPSTTQVDKTRNMPLLQELQAELDPTIVAAVDAWHATTTLDDLLTWVDTIWHPAPLNA